MPASVSYSRLKGFDTSFEDEPCNIDGECLGRLPLQQKQGIRAYPR